MDWSALLHCICIHSRGICARPGSILVVWCSELPIHLWPFSSNPVTRGWEFKGCNYHLSPALTRFVSSPLCVLNQCYLCWGEFVNCSTLLGEELLACLVDLFLSARAVLQQSHELSIKSGVAAKAEKALMTSSKVIHPFLTIFLPLPPKYWHRFESSKRMEPW